MDDLVARGRSGKIRTQRTASTMTHEVSHGFGAREHAVPHPVGIVTVLRSLARKHSGSAIIVLLALVTSGSNMPATGPTVSVISPNGGERLTGGDSVAVQWSVVDGAGVLDTTNVYYRDAEDAPWTRIARDLPSARSFTWFVHNTPTVAARVRVVVRSSTSQGEDVSDNPFTIVATSGGRIATTLRDFHQPGTQPLDVGRLSTSRKCSCHYNAPDSTSIGHGFGGTMMAQAARDPLFYACLAIAEQDAPSSGDLCLRCHSPIGWLGGDSQPTNGSRVKLSSDDRDGVSCDFCHRAVDPITLPGSTTESADVTITNGLLAAHVLPTNYGNGQYVVDSNPRKRGPFAPDSVICNLYHGGVGGPVLESPFLRSSDFCGTCHDVSNPVFTRTGNSADYEAGPLDSAADMISSRTLTPLERTYSEWKNSAFPGGVKAPEFAGTKADGMVSTCQDCHMRDAKGAGCEAALPRENLPLHDLTGGNAWLPPLIKRLYSEDVPAFVNPAALDSAAARAQRLLRKAATLTLSVAPRHNSWVATVTVTNLSGHKLPTGYTDGRRMWLNVVAYNKNGHRVYESGAYDSTTGVLKADPQAVIYEAHLGISPTLARVVQLPRGPSFHFALNNHVYKDNRIPPKGFTNAAFASFGGAPVDDSRPAPRYADGQNWDIATYNLPASVTKVVARLYYQTTSKEYVEFLRDTDTTSAGRIAYDLWNTNGKSAPVAMASDSATVGVEEAGALATGWDQEASRSGENGAKVAGLQLYAPRPSPFVERLTVAYAVGGETGARVEIGVYDVAGRLVRTLVNGFQVPGRYEVIWDGCNDDGVNVRYGVYFLRASVGGRPTSAVGESSTVGSRPPRSRTPGYPPGPRR